MSETAASASPSAASRRLLWVALAATLAASAWALVDDEGDTRDTPVHAPRGGAHAPAGAGAGAKRVAQRPAEAPPPEAPLRLPDRALQLVARRDLFASIEAVSLPATVAAPSTPTPPAPPPPPVLPFTFGGRLITERGPSVLLHEGPQTHVLALGGTLGSFRLDADTGPRIEFVHLPTGERVALTPSP